MDVRRLAYSKAAINTLRRMPANQSSLIQNKLRAYAADPKSQAANVKLLKGSELRRLRVGDWRAIFEESADAIVVIKIGSRGAVY